MEPHGQARGFYCTSAFSACLLGRNPAPEDSYINMQAINLLGAWIKSKTKTYDANHQTQRFDVD